VRDRATDKSDVEAVKAPLSLLLDTELFLLGWPLDVSETGNMSALEDRFLGQRVKLDAAPP